ncbi:MULTISPECIES: transcriptional regulator NosR [unclassified Pseudomonas]|uniref:transcriptional regulator NosR n=2 Tax=unclassified Pseudomonas TaxID=196821 RepID=UPI000C869CBA|nr:MULTISPECIES: NosR/NirI family protein [unclassified Pseudomonas]PMW02743.1 regulatory protein NosR [Pseudomonas sp. GW460-C8]PMW25293.1 regulatory protein NosR [Pseudomonas sp. GW456-11-11-14-TSB2]PMW40499.1 regulatory protein NosR [Pseudomonas sp. GW460-7]PMW68488.1 regulatory protein NosR [Pseudomonas sp. GW456-11-11-14-LB2]PMW86571.1 regulatory protein NosR [Pseudomonas sp. FW306-1C-G01A]PMW89564.1 regulatory protein NosR [Pseudomonas sp. GW460-12-1-14-LB3]PMW99768.1 regulatory protei
MTESPFEISEPMTIHPPSIHGNLRAWGVGLVVMLMLMLATFEAVQAKQYGDIEQQRIEKTFPQTDSVSAPEGRFKVRTLSAAGKVLGYVFQSLDVVDIPAYSGKPINTQVILDTAGAIQDAYVLEHHEPILLIGIPEAKLHGFSARYKGIKVSRRVVVGHSSDPKAVTVDAIAGATVTAMVVNEVIMRAAHDVAVSLKLIEDTGGVARMPATVRQDFFEPATWEQLTGNGAIRRLNLTRGQVDAAFKGTDAEGVENAAADQVDETFIELYTADLNPPTIGRALLGDNQYRLLMQDLKPGEQAIAVLGRGLFSYKGSGYVRGGIFDRVQLRQFGNVISFRDMDHQRLSDVFAKGMPEFTEMSIFIVREPALFDPGSPWSLELLVRRQTGPLSGTFSSFELPYQLPEPYLERPLPSAEELAALEEAGRPMWLTIWYQKSFQITVLGSALLLLMAILFLQDSFTRRPRFLHWLRRGYLVFTVVFLGWYALGQLSVVNVLTFAHALFDHFRWELFLTDPLIFMLWVFTAASILLWGRGVFCGWLCPFGALQELINEAARKLRIPQYELPFAVHERLWAIKYIILLLLFGLSLESMSTAELFAEVEPFKTAVTLKFDRQWWFVLYAVALLVINLFTRKVYCRYICPLGAALAIPSKFRLFDWLKRRKDCGTPCQLCAKECEIQAIHPDGRINANECHYCLDCQMTYQSDNKCPPLINKRKKRGKPAPIAVQLIPVVEVSALE